MAKVLVMPSNKEQINKLLKDVDGFIIGLKDLSVNMPSYYTIDEVKEINELLNKNDKELFVSLNKNIHNSDLEYLKEALYELESMNIKGVIYYDVALINLKQELNLNLDLVFSEEHAVTNYATINYWNMMGAKYAYLANELTLHEIKEISKNSNAILMVSVFGYIPIFVSERKLISNYLNTFGLKNETKSNYIFKEDKKYPILENSNVTEVYSDYILNIVNELKEIENISYYVFNSFNIDKDKFEYVIKSFNFLEEKDMKKLLNNTSKGFLDKEMIYKVKHYENEK